MKSKLLLAGALAVIAAATMGQGAPLQYKKTPALNEDWQKPFPGFKIVGNFYYVGTYDLGCYLIDTGQGLILINTGIEGSYPLIKDNIEKLGFKVSDIKIITSTHGHRDHVGDIAAFQKESGAKVYMEERDAPTLESGGNIDYRQPKGRGFYVYPPIKVDVRTKPGDHIKLGNTDLTLRQAFGHTPGATTFTFTVQDGGKNYNVLIYNSDGINQGVKLLGSPGYPTIVQDFASTLKEQATYKADVYVSSHAGQFDLHKVYKPGDPYNPARFGDMAAYQQKIATATKNYEKQLAEERAAAEK